MPSIQADSHVTLHYRMSVVVDDVERELVNTFDAAPATLQMGVGQWSPDIERHLLGLGEGERLDVQIPAAEAYGVRNPDLLYTLDREQLEAQCGSAFVYAPGETVELAFRRRSAGARYPRAVRRGQRRRRFQPPAGRARPAAHGARDRRSLRR